MDKGGCGQASRSILRKDKKKKTKGEIDRVKQAEKKKRRLEKALATSAAIRSELEKKKQKKMEEQQRLDEEGAAIAESVALLVLGGEDSDCHDLNSCNGFNFLGDTVTAAMPMGYPCLKIYSIDTFDPASDACRSEFKWNGSGIGWRLSAETNGIHPRMPCSKETSHGPKLLAGIAPARALSALVDDSHGGMISGTGTSEYLVSRMMDGEVNFYQEF